MEDIVPELYKKIKSEFDSFIKNDIEIQEILKGENKEESFEDVSFLSGRIGRYANETHSLLPRDRKTLQSNLL